MICGAKPSLINEIHENRLTGRNSLRVQEFANM